MPMLDIFKSDAFGVIQLTDAINKTPFVPGRVGQLLDWAETGVRTLTIAIEEVEGELKLVNPAPRGGVGEGTKNNLRKLRDLRIPHYPVYDAVMADEVQGVRAFGSETEVQTVMALVQQKINEAVQWKHDPTLEYQRVGALKGIILNGDGSTLYNLFTEFGVTQETEIDFDLDNGSPASGVLRKRCTEVLRLIAKNLGGVPSRGAVGVCGDAFWDDLTAHPEFRATYLNQTEAARLRDNVTYQSVDFGGITFENYRGSVGATSFIATDKCHFAPVGVQGLFRTVYAPADYIETVNTIGLPRYAKQWEMEGGKGVKIETQMNALSYCTRPKVLVQARRT